jgi:prepilin-type N-terminal cleavage/methylation domain-containing protein
VSKGRHQYGFTLIELSIVLVIIGLIVGGILTGQTLIAAASVRAQLTQIETYNTAANTFRTKYGYLPGDIRNPDAAKFGFVSRGSAAGEGDGNGVLQGMCSYNPSACIATGEDGMFWVDLSTAHLIDGGFNTATPSTPLPNEVTGSAIAQYFPQAKIGNGNYVYVWSMGTFFTLSPYYTATAYQSTGVNYFGISVLTDIETYQGWPNPSGGSAPGITVAQAYAMDKKVDDGMPTSGNVIALFVGDSDPNWTDGTDAAFLPPPGGPTARSSTSCFDDNSNATAQETYSLSQNNGAGVNCALSFKMQAGD